LEFAESKGAISASERERLQTECWSALIKAANAQVIHQRNSNPALQFVQLIASGLATGRIHLHSMAGREPEDAKNLGWRSEIIRHGQLSDDVLRPQGTHIGWLHGDLVYLDPEATYSAVQKLANEQGDAFALSKSGLNKRLHQDGLLAAVDEARETLTVRRVIDKTKRAVLCMRLNSFVVPSESPAEASANYVDPLEEPIPGDAKCRIPQPEMSGDVGSQNAEPTPESPENSERNECCVGNVGSPAVVETCMDSNSNWDEYSFAFD
jgi:hypothetical protein